MQTQTSHGPNNMRHPVVLQVNRLYFSFDFMETLAPVRLFAGMGYHWVMRSRPDRM
ncbi:hypothetical protein BGLT_01339 [Caballeronia glathei]|nr:hypothetical protein BGLT_01339 [Caballeronia glathei]